MIVGSGRSLFQDILVIKEGSAVSVSRLLKLKTTSGIFVPSKFGNFGGFL